MVRQCCKLLYWHCNDTYLLLKSSIDWCFSVTMSAGVRNQLKWILIRLPFAQSMQFLYCLITVVLYVKINFDIKETFFNRLVLYHNSPLYGQPLQKWREKRSMCLCLDAVYIRLSEVITLLIVSYSKISGANFHIQYVDSPRNL